MKNFTQTLKKNFKYTVCILALTIFAIQIYHIVTEENIKSSEIKVKVPELSVNDDKCKSPTAYVSGILTSIFKCSIAFLFGGLISDRRYVKFGAL